MFIGDVTEWSKVLYPAERGELLTRGGHLIKYMPFVYILQDRISGKNYTGSCLEISKRLGRHQSHTGGRTTAKGDWHLLCLKEFLTIEEARKVEKYLKLQKGGNGFRKVINEWKIKNGDVTEWSKVPHC